MNITALFDNLPQPRSENDDIQFIAIPIPNFENHRLARDGKANPVLLIYSKNEKESFFLASLKLQNVSVLFNVPCKVRQNEEVCDLNFTVISFVGQSQDLKKYFLKLGETLIQQVGNTPSVLDIKAEINKLVELLKFATQPALKSVQGLWAELFFISESKDITKMLTAWHNFPEEKFDFGLDTRRLEVKCTLNPQRIHAFSLEQLNPPEGVEVTIISILTRLSSTGVNITDLVNKIRFSIHDLKLIDKLNRLIAQTLGDSIEEGLKVKYDQEYARRSLKFYSSDDIPKITNDQIPQQVFDVKFWVNLTEVLSKSMVQI